MPTHPRSADLLARGDLLKKRGVSCDAPFLDYERPPDRPWKKSFNFAECGRRLAMMSFYFCISGFPRNKYVVGLRCADSPAECRLAHEDYEHPTELPINNVSLLLLKLCTPTIYSELLFLYFRISAKLICCGFTVCRLARVVPTCSRGAICSRKGVSLDTHL